MLILTRKPGESIMIGDTVEVTVLSISHSVVRIGVNAPQEISVHRNEIYEKIKNQTPLQKKNTAMSSGDLSNQKATEEEKAK